MVPLSTLDKMYEPLCPTRLSMDSDRYKRRWAVQYFNAQLPSQLESKTTRKTSKCLLSMPPVFPMLFIGIRRALATTSVTPSLVARGEPNIHPMIYQLYLCAVCVSLCWIPGPLIRSYHTKVPPFHFLMLIQDNSRLVAVDLGGRYKVST